MRWHNVVEFLCHVLLLIAVFTLCSHPVVAVLSVKGVLSCLILHPSAVMSVASMVPLCTNAYHAMVPLCRRVLWV